MVQDELFDRHQALSKLAASAHSANVEVVNYKLAWAKDKLTGYEEVALVDHADSLDAAACGLYPLQPS